MTGTISSTGGTVSSPDGDVTVDFPPDTVSDTAAVTYTTFQLPLSPPIGTFSFAGNGFDMEMTDLTSGERDTVNNRLVLQIEHLTKLGLFGQRRILLPLVLRQS